MRGPGHRFGVVLVCALGIAAAAGCQRVQMKSSYFSKLSAPRVSLDAMPGMIRGDSDYTVAFTVETSHATRASEIEVYLSVAERLASLSPAPSPGPDLRLITKLPPDKREFDWHTPAQDIEPARIVVLINDTRGNVGAQQSSDFVVRQRDPALTLSKPKAGSTNQVITIQTTKDSETIVLGGSCEKGLAIASELNGKAADSLPCPAGSWEFSREVRKTDRFVYVLSQEDEVGHRAKLTVSLEGPGAPPTTTTTTTTVPTTTVTTTTVTTTTTLPPGPPPQAGGCTPVANGTSPAGVVGDTNLNGCIDNRTIDEIGALSAGIKCMPDLTAWSYDIYSPGREDIKRPDNAAGYKCMAVKCVPTGSFARYWNHCCSEKVDSATFQCID